VDSLFARYDHANTPGCALLVSRDGRTVYERGYGMASLELGVAMTPQTVMDIGSTSKQFTAAAIWRRDSKRLCRYGVHSDGPDPGTCRACGAPLFSYRYPLPQADAVHSIYRQVANP
jgi:hypothetical protein